MERLLEKKLSMRKDTITVEEFKETTLSYYPYTSPVGHLFSSRYSSYIEIQFYHILITWTNKYNCTKDIILLYPTYN